MMNTYYFTNKHTGKTAKVHGRTSAEAREKAWASVSDWELTFWTLGEF